MSAINISEEYITTSPVIIQYIKHYLYTLENKYDNFNNQLELYYTNQNKINYPFIISLDKDYDRYLKTDKLLNDINLLNNIRFPAVYGKDLKDYDIYKKFANLSYGEIGCFLSHVTIYYLASLHENQNQYTIIFEDDIAVANVDMISERILKAAEYNKSIIYLGKCLELCSLTTQVNENLYNGFYPLCTHAYMIKNYFAKKFINYIKSLEIINKPIDHLVNYINVSDEILVYHPSLFYQNSEYSSNLRNKFNQNFNNYECYEDMIPGGVNSFKIIGLGILVIIIIIIIINFNI